MLLVLCSRLRKVSRSWNAHRRRGSGEYPGTLAMAGQSAGQGESHVWRIDHHSIMDRHRCSLRSVVSPCDDIFVVFFLFFIYPLLLSDVLSSFCRLSSPSQWKVYAGYLTLSQMKSAIGNSVMLIISHPGFDTDNNNDIALMKLWTPLQISCELQY